MTITQQISFLQPKCGTPPVGGRVATWLAALTFALVPGLARAQSDFDVVGTRALGMGGAFTAVADDASATWWNPAGLASIPVADAELEGGRLRTGRSDQTAAAQPGAWEARPFALAFGVPVLGFSYSRLTIAEVGSGATGAAEPGRQDTRASAIGRVVRTQRAGVTLVQGVGDLLVVGATVGLVDGGTASVPLEGTMSARSALDRARDLAVDGRVRADAHAGALLAAGPVRLGIVARNLTAPRFDDPDGGSVRLARQVRIGVAYGGGAPAYQRRSWSIAVDADLTTVTAADGRRRAVAAGAERWFGARRLALRGGVRVQTVDGSRTQVTGGASVALRTGTYIEAQASGGADRAAAGWMLAGRVTF